MRTKIRILEVKIITVVKYGPETWVLWKSKEDMLKEN